MNIKELKIKGFKSIGEITLKSPNPFSVFVGANGAGKSNIFEALEFFTYCNLLHPLEAVKFFGNLGDIVNRSNLGSDLSIEFNVDLGIIKPRFYLRPKKENEVLSFKSFSFSDYGENYRSNINNRPASGEFLQQKDFYHLTNFDRLFIGKSSLLKINTQDDSQLVY